PISPPAAHAQHRCNSAAFGSEGARPGRTGPGTIAAIGQHLLTSRRRAHSVLVGGRISSSEERGSGTSFSGGFAEPRAESQWFGRQGTRAITPEFSRKRADRCEASASVL